MEINLYHLQRIKTKIRKSFSSPFYTLQQLGRRFIYRQVGNIFGGHSFHLNNVFLLITLRCDLSCQICSFWGTSGLCKDTFEDIKKENMSLDNWKKLIEEVSNYNPNIIFTGGEPLLYSTWYDLATYVKRKKLTTNLQTNGTHLKENANKIVEIIDFLNVSLDAPKPEINDEIRGVSGAFNKTIEGIKEIDFIKKKEKRKTPIINICYTISSLNYLYLNEMRKFLEEQNFKIDSLIFQHLMFSTKEETEKHEKIFDSKDGYKKGVWRGFEINHCLNIQNLKEEIFKIKNKQSNKLKIIFFPDFEEKEVEKFYDENGDISSRFSKKCLTPWLDVNIFPNGDVFLCPDYVIGNLKKNDFKNIWNNELACSLRKKLLKEGISSICRSCCGLYVY